MAAVSYTYPTQDYRFNAQRACTGENVCELKLLSSEGFGFQDVLDALNPLQQIPGVSSIYRALTGESISNISRMAGGALYGGPIGFIFSAINTGIESGSGLDIGGHVLSMVDAKNTASHAADTYAKTQAL